MYGTIRDKVTLFRNDSRLTRVFFLCVRKDTGIRDIVHQNLEPRLSPQVKNMDCRDIFLWEIGVIHVKTNKVTNFVTIRGIPFRSLRSDPFCLPHASIREDFQKNRRLGFLPWLGHPPLGHDDRQVSRDQCHSKKT